MPNSIADDIYMMKQYNSMHTSMHGTWYKMDGSYRDDSDDLSIAVHT